MEERRPATFDHLRSKKKPVTRKVVMCFDSDLQDAWELLQLQVRQARSTLTFRDDELAKRELDDLLAQAEAMKPQMEEATVEFKFRSLSRKAYDALQSAHLPTPTQLEEAKKEGGGTPSVNPDTFPPALIAASCVEPEMTADDAKALWEDDENWSQGELTMLYENAIAVNQQRRVIDLGKD